MSEGNKIEMTVEDVVKNVVANLESINVPIGLTQQVAQPILLAVENLRMCIRAWERERIEEMKPENALCESEFDGKTSGG